MTEKRIILQTNYNGKLGCNRFVHLDLAPATPVPESVVEDTVIIFETKDNSHPPVKTKMIDMARMPLNELRAVFPHLSHGMDISDFVQHLLSIRPETSLTAELGAYFYEKIEA